MQDLILQGTPEARGTAYTFLLSAARAETFDEAFFVTPFVTRRGAEMLIGIAEAAEVELIDWIVGLDETITAPDALRLVARSAGTRSLRGWTTSPIAPSLHAKVYLMFGRHPNRVLGYIGSANATEGGLSSNIEAGFLVKMRDDFARRLRTEVHRWLGNLAQSPRCIVLGDRELADYARRFRTTREGGKIGAVIGVRRERPISRRTTGDYAWIELAVRGGSSNQIEICRDMATFFTGVEDRDRVEFSLVDQLTGQLFEDNAYRFRGGNSGHRVEVNTGFSRLHNLIEASRRRDIIVFRKSPTPDRYVVEIYPADRAATRALIAQGEQEGRVRRTIAGQRGRNYYV